MSHTEQSIEPVVVLEKISMAYKKPWSQTVNIALNEVSLKITKGETVGFVGNNGAGKSTTLRIILGLQKPTSGLALLNGRPVVDHEARKGVAYVSESPYLYDYLTPLELLKHGSRMHRCHASQNEKALETHCMAWLERFRIQHVANKRIRTFSKGMTQRVALAHALACQPEFLILDEPLSGLDPIGRQEVVVILDEFRVSGKTLFFSSHVLNDVERLADRFVFIDKGIIQAVCSTSEALAECESGYIVTVEGVAGIDGFEKISSRLWQKEVKECDLPLLIDDISRNKNSTKMTINSIKNINNLERAYCRFVQKIEEAGA